MGRGLVTDASAGWSGSVVLRSRAHTDDDVLHLGMAFQEGAGVRTCDDDPETPLSRILEREPDEPLADPATLVRRQRLRVDEGDVATPDDVVEEAGELAVLTRLVTVGRFAIADVERHAPMVTFVWLGDGRS